LPKDAFERLSEEIEKRLARKTHANLLKVVVDALKEGGEESVKKEIKARLETILEE
jgi:hypothetical protein